MHTAGTMRTSIAMAAAIAVLALLLMSCGGDGSVTLPSPTGSDTAGLPSRTVSLEGPTRSASRSASVPEVTSGSAGPTSSSSPVEEPQTTSSTDGSSVPSWAWWLLAGLGLLGAALATILVVRGRRRQAWDADLQEAEQEARWFAQELLPGLEQAGSADEVAGGWRVAAGRVTLIEDRLTGMSSAAPDEARGPTGPCSAGCCARGAPSHGGPACRSGPVDTGSRPDRYRRTVVCDGRGPCRQPLSMAASLSGLSPGPVGRPGPGLEARREGWCRGAG